MPKIAREGLQNLKSLHLWVEKFFCLAWLRRTMSRRGRSRIWSRRNENYHCGLGISDIRNRPLDYIERQFDHRPEPCVKSSQPITGRAMSLRCGVAMAGKYDTVRQQQNTRIKTSRIWTQAALVAPEVSPSLSYWW
jgi:hypothetical protein